MNLLSNWFVLAFLGMCSFAGMALTLKKLSYTIPVPIILLYVFALCSFAYAGFSAVRGHAFFISGTSLLYIALAAALAFLGNLFDVEALRLAPNAGYATAIKSGQIIIITLSAYFLFSDQSLSWSGMFGVLLIVAGVSLLAMQQ